FAIGSQPAVKIAAVPGSYAFCPVARILGRHVGAAVDGVRLANAIGAAALGHRLALFNDAGAVFLAGKWSRAMGEHGTACGKRADAGNAAKNCELPPHPLPPARRPPLQRPARLAVRHSMNAARPSDPAARPMPSPRISPLDHGSNAAALCRPQAKGCSVAQRHSLSPGIAVHQRGAQRRNREGRDRPRQKNAAESDSNRKYARGRVRPGSLTTRFLPSVASYPLSNIQLKRLLKRGFQLQMVEPVHRLDLDSTHLAVLQHIERNRVARAPLSPDLAIEIGQAFGLLALDADDHVAPLDARPLRRARP